MIKEEEFLYNKIVSLKESHDKLLNIMKELDSLVKMGYDGPFMGEDIRPLTTALMEYKTWEKQQPKETNSTLVDPFELKNTEECLQTIPGTFIACGEDGNYCSQNCLNLANAAQQQKE